MKVTRVVYNQILCGEIVVKAVFGTAEYESSYQVLFQVSWYQLSSAQHLRVVEAVVDLEKRYVFC